MKVVAVIVTYNRKDFLIRTIESVFLQTFPVSNVVIIDNNSTDGTSELLKKSGICARDGVIYKKLEENSGGSGGFTEGFKTAIASGADWIWVMDDDVAPRPDCLDKLMGFSSISECIHPRKILPGGQEDSWEQNFNFKLSIPFKIEGNKSFKNGKEVVFTNVACFEGMLVSKEVVKKVGFPYEDYFITHDDVLFGGVASLHTNVSYVRDAVIDKLIQPGKARGWKLYYYVRNSFWAPIDYSREVGSPMSASSKFLLATIRSAAAFLVMFRSLDSVLPSVRGVRDGLKGVLSDRRK